MTFTFVEELIKHYTWLRLKTHLTTAPHIYGTMEKYFIFAMCFLKIRYVFHAATSSSYSKLYWKYIYNNVFGFILFFSSLGY